MFLGLTQRWRLLVALIHLSEVVGLVPGRVLGGPQDQRFLLMQSLEAGIYLFPLSLHVCLDFNHSGFHFSFLMSANWF